MLETVDGVLKGELPPRARRIPASVVAVACDRGTTSACAENTTSGDNEYRILGNYLRVRGEYPLPKPAPCGAWELPPRARRIPTHACQAAALGGTTSACAENTVRAVLAASPSRNYLRVRGEYAGSGVTIERRMELPPRARRIPWMISPWWNGRGTTSACAENTIWKATPAKRNKNYLRVRGEYPK